MKGRFRHYLLVSWILCPIAAIACALSVNHQSIMLGIAACILSLYSGVFTERGRRR